MADSRTDNRPASCPGLPRDLWCKVLEHGQSSAELRIVSKVLQDAHDSQAQALAIQLLPSSEAAIAAARAAVARVLQRSPHVVKLTIHDVFGLLGETVLLGKAWGELVATDTSGATAATAATAATGAGVHAGFTAAAGAAVAIADAGASAATGPEAGDGAGTGAGAEAATGYTDADANTVYGCLLALAPRLQQLKVPSLCMLPPLLRLLSACTALQHLDISHSRIGARPGAAKLAHALQSMPHLTHLAASDCGLTCRGMTALAPVLEGLTLLRHLDLSSNRINTISGDYAGVVRAFAAVGGMTDLKTLDLHDNPLYPRETKVLVRALAHVTGLQHLLLRRVQLIGVHRQLAGVIKRMPDLRTLDLHDTTTDEQGLRAVVRSLRDAPPPRLETLSLSGSAVAEVAGGVAAALRALTGLRHLDLSWTELDAHTVATLAPAIATLVQLETLEMGVCELEPRCADSLAASFAAASALHELDTSNPTRSGGRTALMPELCQQRTAPSLRTLDLSYSHFSGGSAGLTALLQRMTALQHLNLENDYLGPDAAARLAPALGQLQLQTLNLAGNRLDAAALAVLAPALHAASMRSLSLASNHLCAEGARHLAPVLAAMRGLRELDLGNCELGPDGCALLEPALRCLTRLTRLNMEHNQLGTDGAIVLARALKEMQGLERLYLTDNGLGPEAALALSPALEAIAGSLQSLLLSQNELGPGGMRALAPVLRSMRRLTYLNLSETQLKKEGGHVLADCMLSCLPELRLLFPCRRLNIPLLQRIKRNLALASSVLGCEMTDYPVGC